ncbi:MAG: Ig-like domain-containing protein, partial [Pseudomonadota bacterium]
MTPISTYGVIGAWKMTNSSSPRLTAEYWIYKVSAGGGDVTAPTVSMTAPASGATVSGVATTVSATASDNVGVAGVQFKLDGVALGTEDTATPFSISWNTTTASNGVHTLTATARDAAGNSTTSAGVNVTVSNAGGSDFTTRCTAAIAAGGRCIPFDASSEIANTTWGGNTGLDLGFNGGKPPPVIDTTVKASGAGSLKFTISSQSPANGAGAYWANFSTDLSARYGAGQTFYVQWRQRFSPEQLSNVYNAIGGGIDNGWKTADFTTGDRAGTCTSAEAAEGCQNQLGVAAFTSCTAIELVTQNVLQRGFLQAYQSCTGSSSRPFAYAGFQRQYPSGIIPLGMDCGLDCYLQDATATPFCLYSQRPGVGSGFFPPNGNCIQFVANEWMTFKVKITIGPRGSGFVPGASPNDEFVNSNFEMWIAREGQPSIKAFNYGPFNMSAGSTTADLKFGKVYLEPYQTNKDATQVHPTAFTWYDELIISPQDIADPGITDTTNPTVA